VRQGREYFAEWLNRTLTERGIAGGAVARALKVNDSAISRWRNGKASPGLDSVMSLADFLEVDHVALAVTAGLMDGEKVGVHPLPLPEDTRTRLFVKEQIMNIKGLTKEERSALVLAYEERNPSR
jgi:transcriptional regulator with XRE-family HTH domain